MSEEIRSLDATGQAELVAKGEVTSRELVDIAVTRANEVNPEINAIIHLDYEAAAELSETDLPDGPFTGVPFVFKDLGAGLAGKPFHMGNRLLKEIGFTLPVDTALGTRYRNMGVVPIGKTNTPELGILSTTEPESHGAAKNPWDTTRSTGGSSGGSAAAVAAGIIPMAHATDGGGSIRIPASACGLVGLKPSRARVSQAPLIGDSFSGLVCELCVSKSVRDTATVLDYANGPEPGDPYGCPAPDRPYVEELGADPGRLNIALLTESLTGDVLEPAVIEAAQSAAGKLEALGHNIIPAEIPEMGDSDELYETFMTRWAAGMANTAGIIEKIAGRELTADDVEPLTWALMERGRLESGADYLEAVGTHQLLSRMIAGYYATGVDLILSPTMGAVPPKLGHYDQYGDDVWDAILKARLMGTFTGVFNATGQPAMSLPLAMSDEGLPIGIQFAAPMWREDMLIRLAAQLEEAHPWAERRAPAFAADERVGS